MDLMFHLVKRFTVSIFLCRGREVESEKLFGLDLGLVKTILREGGGYETGLWSTNLLRIAYNFIDKVKNLLQNIYWKILNSFLCCIYVSINYQKCQSNLSLAFRELRYLQKWQSYYLLKIDKKNIYKYNYENKMIIIIIMILMIMILIIILIIIF